MGAPPGTAGPASAGAAGARRRAQLHGGPPARYCRGRAGGGQGCPSGRRRRAAAPDRYCFRINQRSEEQVGNIKQVWEISRLQHLTLLATAWYLSHDPAYADRVAEQLRSWWRENPFLSGVHWTSGIEIGVRLISFAWIRRLLDDWPGVGGLFEDNGLAVAQIRWHQRYLAGFRSRGSSANNHVIAEAAGQLVASCAFGWFPESERWRRQSARLLEDELIRNTFPSGINRELASDYHGFVTELGLLAAVETAASGSPLGMAAWRRLAAMADCASALVDEQLRPPRQGDGDEGRALLLDAPQPNRWPSLLALGSVLFGRLDWWPPAPPGASTVLIGALAGAARAVAGRPAQRPSRFADAGLTLLRTTPGEAPEIWCRCDGGPHGFLSIAAHAHADALSVEVRHGGVDVLADPGTYCYHGDPPWRAYFRSTIAHNTVELAGRSQSGDGGPFLWLQHARGREIEVRDTGDRLSWTAEHDGYRSLTPPAGHRRRVLLDGAARTLEITDEIEGGSHDVRLAFHLGPEVRAELVPDGSGCTVAILQWPGRTAKGAALLALPDGLRWSLHRGGTDPILGWYAEGFGRRSPAARWWAPGRRTPNQLSSRDWSSMTSLQRLIRPSLGQTYNCRYLTGKWHRHRISNRRPDERTGLGPEEVFAAHPAALACCLCHRGIGPGRGRRVRGASAAGAHQHRTRPDRRPEGRVFH